MSAIDTAYSHLSIDPAGRVWIKGANVEVCKIVADYLAHRSSAEEMALQFPHLSPSMIHSALELDRVLFSQDDDLLVEAERRQRESLSFAGVIYAHQLEITVGRCVRDLEIIAKAAEPTDIRNRVEFLPL